MTHLSVSSVGIVHVVGGIGHAEPSWMAAMVDGLNT